MTEARVYLWNADCTPSVDENGEQLWVPASQVKFLFDVTGQPILDLCGRPAWEWKVAETTTQAPVVEPPVIDPPVTPINRGIDFKFLLIATAVLLVLGYFLS